MLLPTEHGHRKSKKNSMYFRRRQNGTDVGVSTGAEKVFISMTVDSAIEIDHRLKKQRAHQRNDEVAY